MDEHRPRCAGQRLTPPEGRPDLCEYWSLELDYPVRPRPRYGYGKAPHRLLDDLVRKNRHLFEERLHGFLRHAEHFRSISPLSTSPSDPYWDCGWLSCFDLASLYSFVADLKPTSYVELGSGCSTLFIRRAVQDQLLRTKVCSIDPEPRVPVDIVCDVVVRVRLEDLDLAMFAGLSAGDVVFVDGTHRCFTNSDVTVMVLEVLPMLPPGIFVGIHDIFLPWDYPPEWGHLFYSEQYLLAAYLLGSGRADVILPLWYISQDRDLCKILDPLWADLPVQGLTKNGSVFWLRTS